MNREMARIHSCLALKPQYQKGRAMGLNRVFANDGLVRAPGYAAGIIPCHVDTQTSMEKYQQEMRGAVILHTIYFDIDPLIDERYRLQWLGGGNNSIMRLDGVPLNVLGAGAIWFVKARTLTEDNIVGGTVIVEIE
jgi:hypothetical protein